MSVLVFLDQADGHIKKSSFEAANYAAKTASLLGTDAQAVVLGTVADDLSALGNYGITKVHSIADASLNNVDAQVYTKVLQQVVEATGADVIVFTNNSTAKAVSPRLSVALKAGLVPGAIALPATTNGFTVRKTVFSGKAFANITVTTPKKIISLNPNSFQIVIGSGTAEVVPMSVNIPAAKVEMVSVEKVSGEVSLSEADIVVSGGRGLKGPENWGMVTELAGLLGAATACSRPVADINWRPHHEHVGQTGLAIAPNLYIAIGISGAIQHLAGVNRSKTIVVINKDPEAPFFKAADYGIVGDAFEVVPKIIEAVKKLKGVA
ncbi:MAG: electron transfer flavoprotein subunit alpha/FixB family protein [Ferruginibacter sp.]